MYINLGSTNIKYPTLEKDDFLIFSEIVDSQVGYEKPIIVRTVKELDIWFGNNFTSREYFEELLNSGVSLFLYRPMSDEDNTSIDGYINYSNFTDRSGEFYTQTGLPKSGSANKIYKVYNPEGTGEYLDNSSGLTYDKLIWMKDFEEYTDIKDLPQNNQINTKSWLNRDTLRLNSLESTTEYTHPKYNRPAPVMINNLNLDTLNLKNLNLEKIEKGYQTLVFNISLPEQLTDGAYIVIPGADEKTYLLYYKQIPEVNPKYYTPEADVNVQSVENILTQLYKIGYTYDSNKGLLYASFPVQATYFYNFPGLELTPNYLETHNILASISRNKGVIDFWSKTIGSNGYEEGDISIQVEELTGEFNYRVTVERFDYVEVFEGTLEEGTENERLDYIISKNSNLVYCNLLKKEKLPTGTWKMKGAVEEKFTPKFYKKALNEIFKSGDTVFFDYLLIPDISKYEEDLDIEEGNHYKIYDTLLEYAELINCQILIENTLIENTEKENYLFNYTDDKYNRLVYFYNGLSVKGNDRPGYYLFLRGLLSGIYSITTDLALYQSPVNDPYSQKEIDIDKYKSNYLIDNGITYFYKNYLNGKDYITTVWMRFALGKIGRELEKNKWNYLSERITGKLISKIVSILERIRDSFSIIRYINVTKTEFDYTNNRIDLTIETGVSDLIENNISVDITINYNKL